MNTKNIISKTLFILLVLFIVVPSVKAQNGPMDPMKEDTWLLNAGFGAGTPFFGNGNGFGPAAKFSFEKGMWKAGPGVITLGAEVTFSYFWNSYGDGWHENWFNFIMGARSAYHYGWEVRGLDTYAGIPLGFGLCMNSHDANGGYHTATPVYPYFGVFLGASYFFTPQFGVYGEFGYNSTYGNIGLVFKLD
ncbi:MAG: hypothetical protein NTX43_11875 [Bacteroidetes bacterium]|nr:hypothetical protein [Bacteroidota bacterium]